MRRFSMLIQNKPNISRHVGLLTVSVALGMKGSLAFRVGCYCSCTFRATWTSWTREISWSFYEEDAKYSYSSDWTVISETVEVSSIFWISGLMNWRKHSLLSFSHTNRQTNIWLSWKSSYCKIHSSILHIWP